MHTEGAQRYTAQRQAACEQFTGLVRAHLGRDGVLTRSKQLESHAVKLRLSSRQFSLPHAHASAHRYTAQRQAVCVQFCGLVRAFLTGPGFSHVPHNLKAMLRAQAEQLYGRMHHCAAIPTLNGALYWLIRYCNFITKEG